MQSARKVVLRYREVRNRHLSYQLGISNRLGLRLVAVHMPLEMDPNITLDMALDMALGMVEEIAAAVAAEVDAGVAVDMSILAGY